MVMKKTVVQVIGSLSMGGAETLVKDYTAYIDKEKYNVIVLVLSKRIGSKYEELIGNMTGVEVRYIGEIIDQRCRFKNSILKRIYAKIVRKITIEKELADIKPDIIHIHLNGVKYFIRYSIQNPQTRLFYTCHTVPNKMFVNRKDTEAVNKLIHYNTLKVIALHDEMKEEVNRLFKTESTLVLRNGIAIERFMNPGISKEEMRSQLGIPNDAFVIGHVGYFHKDKNHTFIVDIVNELIKRGENIYVLFVGSGNLKAEIVQKIDALGWGERVIILSNRTDIPELLHVMDVFLFPSLYEGFPIALVEAQAAGIKCVVADNITEEVHLSEQYFTVSLEAPISAWCDAIMDSENGTEPCCSIYDLDIKKNVKKLEAIYEGEI